VLTSTKDEIMNQQIKDGRDSHHPHSSARASAINVEVDALRQRMEILEETLSAYRRNRRRHPQINSRMMVVGLLLATIATIWMLSGLWSVVHGQRGVDPLTIDKNGNVGIRTTTPSTTLDVNGDLKASTASINGVLNAGSVNAESVRFPDGTLQATAAPPAGAVIAFNLPACPAGWSEYTPAQGRFIRGVDKSGGRIDSDGQRSPGSTQEDAIRNITGSITGVRGAGRKAWDWGFRPGTSGAFSVPFNLSKYNPYGGGEYEPEGGVGFSANFDASRVVNTAPENRPKNVALLYCEKR
jgi:hypothetical protein